jgi:hypothetical protein
MSHLLFALEVVYFYQPIPHGDRYCLGGRLYEELILDPIQGAQDAILADEQRLADFGLILCTIGIRLEYL